MNETVTVRVQKVRKNRIRVRLTLFLILTAALLLVAIFADKIVPYDPYAQGLSNSLLPPSAEHWMGTDRYGRDMFSRVVVGAQTSIFSTLALKRSGFVAAARLSGDSSMQMILRHILPNILGPILVTAMLDIGTMMMELAGLSFLNLGAQPPTAEWGNMMSGGRSMLQTYPWLVLSPGFAIFLSVVIFNLLGDTVRDYMDPKNSRAR